MKTLSAAILILFSLSSFSQNDTKLPDGIDGEINYTRGNYFQFSKSDKSITRTSNKMSLKLDSLVYFLPKKKDYYVNFNIKLFDDINEEPIKSFTYLIKDIVSERKGGDKKQFINNQILASGINLKNIKFLKIRTSIVEIKNKNEEFLNTTLDGFLDEVIEGVPYANLIGKLLSSQDDDEDDILLFNKTYDIPLNNIEYSFKKSTSDSTRLLSSKKPLYIPMTTDIQKEYIDPSIASYLFGALSKLTNIVSGVNGVDGKNYQINGMIKLRITNDDNLNLPIYIESKLNKFVLSVNPLDKDSKNYLATKTNLLKDLQTYESSAVFDEKVNYSIKTIMILADAYKTLLDKEKIMNGAIIEGANNARIEFQDFRRTFKHYYDRSSYQENEFGFVSYGIKDNIYAGKWARIFIPYSLTSIANNEVINWQINVHEKLNEFNDGEYSMSLE
jgi:hypothetical protein